MHHCSGCGSSLERRHQRQGLTERLLRKSLVIARGECRGRGGQKNAVPRISRCWTHVPTHLRRSHEVDISGKPPRWKRLPTAYHGTTGKWSQTHIRLTATSPVLQDFTRQRSSALRGSPRRPLFPCVFPFFPPPVSLPIQHHTTTFHNDIRNNPTVTALKTLQTKIRHSRSSLKNTWWKSEKLKCTQAKVKTSTSRPSEARVQLQQGDHFREILLFVFGNVKGGQMADPFHDVEVELCRGPHLVAKHVV